MAAVLALGLAGCGSDDASVPVPEAEGRQATAAELARAAQTQGLCYGWILGDGSGNITSQGSNLGDNVAVESDPQRCPKWVRVRAEVSYVPEFAEAEDYATVWVDTSPDLTVGPSIRSNLDRFGLTEKAFLDDPTLAISRAALALPLLTAEAGAAEPAPTPSAAATGTPPALKSPGNDFLRDRAGYLVAAAIVLLVAGLFLLIGIWQRKVALRLRQAAPAVRQKKAGEAPAAGGRPATGTRKYKNQRGNAQ